MIFEHNFHPEGIVAFEIFFFVNWSTEAFKYFYV
jgi:hypothetical protein